MASGLLPKSPVSSSLCDEVPHIFIPKSHLEPREILISSAKRLLQHNRHLTDKPPAPEFVAYWANNGQKAALGLNKYAANDPTATLAVHCGNCFNAGFRPYRSTRLSR
jgi:hypothetical protein